ncbi:Adaptin [Candidatus Sulfotelmatobacter sp. SbA7]|nr:Adaptin [Candidatus Sulfotelmatobacter sp. SbA7]
MTVSSNPLLNKLRGGDRRSIGQSNTVVALVLRRPALFPQLIQGLWNSDPLIRMRAADAAEKVSLRRPGLLQPFKARLLRLLDEATQQELRWHLAQMIPRLPLSKSARDRATTALERYLDDKSSIVKTSAMQALTDLASTDDARVPKVKQMLTTIAESGTAAMKARSRKLLRQLER